MQQQSTTRKQATNQKKSGSESKNQVRQTTGKSHAKTASEQKKQPMKQNQASGKKSGVPRTQKEAGGLQRKRKPGLGKNAKKNEASSRKMGSSLIQVDRRTERRSGGRVASSASITRDQ